MTEQARPPASEPVVDADDDRFERRDALRALAALGLAVSGCCCGGGDLAGVGTGGTGQVAFSGGTISGFGSVIVNGVKFDDIGARVTDDADRVHGPAQLSIGMLAEIEGRVGDAGIRGVAERIRVVSELRSPIVSIDATGSRFTVPGKVVQTGPATLFPEARGLAGLSVGAFVEVHGFRDSGATVLRATLVSTPAATAPAHKLRGTLAGRDENGGFRIGSLTIDPGGATVANAPRAACATA